MVSIPSLVKKSQPQGTDITIQLSLAQTRISTLETENRALKQQLLWEDRLFANPYLSPSQKIVARTTVPIVKKTANPQDGLAKVYIPSIAEKVGLSPKTVGKTLQFLADTGAIVREAETETDQYGQKITRVYIGLTEQVKRPDQIKPTEPRNHGGYRETCPSCGSENLLEEKKIICTNCGTVIRKTQRLVNTDPTDGQVDYRSEDDQEDQHAGAEQKTTLSEDPQPTNNLVPLLKPKEPMDNLTAGEKPATPPEAELQTDREIKPIAEVDAVRYGLGLPTTHDLDPGSTIGHPATGDNQDLQKVAGLFLDIAGDAPEHIVMSRGAKKYITVHRGLTTDDMLAHLAGEKTTGAALKHADATTRALCFDADNQTTWHTLQEAAQLLAANGYKPILEPSPAGRGGHLWIIFSARVNANAAYAQVCQECHAPMTPMMKEISEYWPQHGNQKVRLPAGKYISASVNQWCYLYDANGLHLSKSDLLTYQTPAQIVPALPELPALEETPPAPQYCASREIAPDHSGVDETWLAKYGKSNLWFAWTEKQLAAWYNEKTSVYDLLTPERNGNGLATWRGERTASVVFRDDDVWVDFGATARRADGKQDGGDSLELAARIEQRPKREVMSDIGKQLLQEVRAALDDAAKKGEHPPLWIQQFMTPAGWQHYEKLRSREHSGGVTGFIPSPAQEDGQSRTSDTTQLWQTEQQSGELLIPTSYEGSYPPPQRPCMCCNVEAWQWIGDKYVCSNPGHPRE